MNNKLIVMRDSLVEAKHKQIVKLFRIATIYQE